MPKGDVLMIDARLSEAQYGLVSAEQNYTVALHNFNILRGTDPDLAVELAQGIRDSLPQPVRVLPDEVLGRRPDYMAARLRSEQADAGIRAARAPFNPQVSVGIGGSWRRISPTGRRHDGRRLGVRETHAPDFHGANAAAPRVLHAPSSGRASGTPRCCTTISCATR